MSTPLIRPVRTGPTLALLAFASLITALDYNIVYVALPEIGATLGFSAHSLQWVISGYAVAFGGFLLLGGRASDLIGRRRMFGIGLFLYAAFSLLGGMASSPGLLVAARAGQGLGGAVLFPATLSLVNTTFAEGAERNRALAVWGAAGGSGMVLGSLLGGVLTQVFGWQAVFYVNVPLAGAALLLTFVLIAPDRVIRTHRRFDLPGAITATVGSTLVVFALVQGPEAGWTSPVTVLAAVAGLLLLTVFALVESRSADPLMPPRLLRNRNLTTGVAVTFGFMATYGTLQYFLTVYFQQAQGYSALRTGLAFLVPMAAVVGGSHLGGRLATRFGVRTTLVASLVLGAVGTAAVGLLLPAGYLILLPGLIVLSLGQGIAYTTMFVAAGTGIGETEQGISSGIVSTSQQVGGAVGLALLVGVADLGAADITGGLRTSILLASLGIAALIGVALNFRSNQKRGRS